MSKLLVKISVVLLLLLGIAGAVMSYLLFEQREIIKGRTQKLENAIISLAPSIETGDEDGGTMVVNREELKVFKAVPGGPQVTMDTPLNRLISGSQSQLNRLNDTRGVLAETRGVLADTQGTLKQTMSDLQAARDNITQLNGIIVARNRTIDEKESAIRVLETEKSEMNAKIADQSLEIADLNATRTGLEDKVNGLELENKRLLQLIVKSPIGTNLGEGQLGEIVYVDPNWNFCVLDVANEKLGEMLPNIELLIHRGDEFVSKVRITKVVEPFVIAEIMDEWLQTDMKKGDSVITGGLH